MAAALTDTEVAADLRRDARLGMVPGSTHKLAIKAGLPVIAEAERLAAIAPDAPWRSTARERQREIFTEMAADTKRDPRQREILSKMAADTEPEKEREDGLGGWLRPKVAAAKARAAALDREAAGAADPAPVPPETSTERKMQEVEEEADRWVDPWVDPHSRPSENAMCESDGASSPGTPNHPHRLVKNARPPRRGVVDIGFRGGAGCVYDPEAATAALDAVAGKMADHLAGRETPAAAGELTLLQRDDMQVDGQG